jgi:hypothetical protein
VAQTKKKRRSKHRGNAAGTVEARGRTGRKPTAEEQKKASAGARKVDRLTKPPTWNAAIIRAVFAAVLLFVMTQVGLTGSKLTLAGGLALAAFSMALYIPLGYAFDRFMYKRRMARLGKPS